MSDKKKELRSRHWYGGTDKDGFIHRSWMKNQGFPDHVFDGRPIIGICNTWSELTPCNSHLRILAEGVKRGVWEAGGFPVEFPVSSLGETQMRPTAMLFRNLLAMDVEEAIRAYGIDGVVLLGGCDKTTPGQLMGAASVDLPTIVVSSGPMLNGKWKGKDIGSGTDVWKFSEAVRAGDMSMQEFMAAESGMSRSPGVCMTMGTATTMASIVEAMGLSLPTNAALPAVDARRMALSHMTGKRIVEMVHEDLRLSKVLTKKNFENGIIANAAVGGSTNAVVHMLAIAGRAGVDLCLEDFDRVGSQVPCIVNCMPSGKYLIEDLAYAGGLPAVMNRIQHLLHADAPTVFGVPISKYWEDAEVYNDDVIRPLDNPLRAAAGIRVLKGNLAPNGAVIKPSAASEHLLVHEGPAYVFETIEELKAKIDDPDLPVTEDTILVLKGCGPKGYPGMAEVGNMPIPRRLVEKGVRDMVRVSDARMSGTAFGTVVLHVSPESNAGGPLAIVKTGDRIRLDAMKGELNLMISEEEFATRMAAWQAPPPKWTRGYYKLYQDTVLQADKGADLDFLVGGSGSEVLRESH
ncbi:MULTISPECIES: IlvD/Edd family dehydratase [Ensifer]|jgi:dihydroxy-acid dehydratase|uniref:IlvD/Edd family dehydratase n=1 Tax=Ensifer TaxID=106591 RepID=UPI00088A0F5F|nr:MULTISPECIES: IlvD/Edd family dehydratase [Ensifer]MBD9555523.1 dihydroxy-acid dehydratase [Ensifer sp. ENS03]MBD9592595.1 dihydroxy-acid dehydratase [Ensifer sp. ENS05]MBD9622139.1 dihydroxy-acid dehydratase [Ensifer sp. ENS06]OKP81362.1 dihydroxy-acid dehydratase [Ensifer adhaerens]UTV37163.1 dihydroxy-acid dehydratase [Ensifer adhaerens]